MAAGGGPQQSIRKAIGALKDSTTVGLAKVNSENKGIDVAIVKATNHDEVLSKEKHIKTIFTALSASSPRADVAYCIHGLTKRLAKTHNWTVALKALIAIHRALREVDPMFREELINYSRGRALMLNLSHFRDDSSPNAWDYSAWVRTYALYLEEHLECFRILKYDVEKDQSITRELDTPDLLEYLPVMQQLLFRLLGCKPEGAAVHNSLIHYALSIVASESVKLYVTITDGILNLVDKYFEMQRHDAIRALEIYKKAESQGEKLSEFFEFCRGLDFGGRQNFVKIEQPPPSFMTAMEDYVAEAPHVIALQCTALSIDQHAAPRELPAAEAVSLVEQFNDDNVEEQCVPSVASQDSDQSETAAPAPVSDLLGLEELTSKASELDEKNSLALAIVTSDNPLNCENRLDMPSQNTSWELALVTAPSSNEAAAHSKLAGGLDKLTLDSLYDNAIARRLNQNGAYDIGQVASNSFDSAYHNQDPFYAYSNAAPPSNVQTAVMSQEQPYYLVLQQQQQQQQQSMVGHDSSSTNPFGNPFEDQSHPAQSSNPSLS